MASLCNINDAKQQKLGTYVYTQLKNFTKFGPEELKQMVSSMFTDVTAKNVVLRLLTLL